jgi:6-phosphogluconolactonase
MKGNMRKKILSTATLLLILSAVLSCGGSKSNNCGTTTNDVTVQYVWVANESAQSISGYQLSSVGELTASGSTPPTGGGGPHEIAFDPASKLLFVLNHLTANVSVFKVDEQSGALTAVSGSPFSLGAAQVTSMALHTSGKFLFVTDSVNGLHAFAVNTATGELTVATGSPFANGMIQPEFAVVHPGGKFVYVANATAPLTVTGYTVDATNGTIAAMQAPFSLGTNTPVAMLTDADGKYLFVATSEGTLSYFDIDATTGELTENTHSPIDVPSASGVQLAMTGRLLYVLDTTARWIDLYAMQQDGSLAAPGSQQLNGTLTPSGIAVDQNGKYLMVTDSSGATIATYSINTSTGELTSVGAAVASGAGAGHIATGNLVKQVTTPVPCDGSTGGGGWH